MDDIKLLMYLIFTISIVVMMWRPKGLNETVPTTIGAAVVLLVGIVPYSDILRIIEIISGASITIISTIVMSIILESIGFFKWVAQVLVKKIKGSGIRLYVYVLLICFLMTIFFNNDGSILITTPIIIRVLSMLRLKPHQKIAYLLSGSLIATASSAPIAVSNISNLIALEIVGLDLNSYVLYMFVPSMLGIFTLAILLYLYFRRDIPQKLEYHHQFKHDKKHPLQPLPTIENKFGEYDWNMFKICISIVILVRVGFFTLATFNIPIEWIAIIGALLLILIRWYRYKMGIGDIIRKTPWHIILFAFSMYVLVYGLRNVGLTDYIVENLGGLIDSNYLNASLIIGGLLTLFSNIFNNLPAVMIGTLSLMEMNLDVNTLQVAYLANVLGSDIGSLLTPIGTLATLIWMYILKKNHIHLTWSRYIKVTIMVVPLSLLVSLIALYIWASILLP